MIKAKSNLQQSRRPVASAARSNTSRDDYDLTCGWLAAGRGDPYERYASHAFKEGYLLRLLKPRVPTAASASMLDAITRGQVH
jgi:hypothetical protein